MQARAETSVWRSLRDRERGAASSAVVARRLTFTESQARQLTREATLSGHTGCVNRLAWSENGEFLASGSDDRSLRVWRYPNSAQRPLIMETHHQGNIFGVAFLPATGNRELVSGAMDYTVQHHVMEAVPAAASRPQQHAAAGSAGDVVTCQTTMYTAHKGRIKDLEVAPAQPNQFWSASEDGAIREYDKRCSTASQRDYESANVLLEVKHKGRPVELKSVAINKARPHQMAVAAGDAYLRLYDRRMLSLAAPSPAGVDAAKPLMRLAPPHLTLDSGTARRPSVPHGTYVKFGNRGDKVVATYHGDHAYTFDVAASATSAAAAALAPPSAGAASRVRPRGWLSAEAEVERGEGFQALVSEEHSLAALHYTRAARLAPSSALLLTKRATALHARGWIGDAVFALRDVDAALALEPGFAEAQLLRPEVLASLAQLEAALEAAEQCMEAHPELSEDIARVFAHIEDRMEERARDSGEHAATARMLACARGEDLDLAAAGGTMRGRSPAAAGDRRPQPQSRQGVAAGRNPLQMAPAAEPDPLAGTSAAASTGSFSRGGSSSPSLDSMASDRHSAGGQEPCRPFAPWQSDSGQRLLQRFVGHCNCATDIKEAAFLGAHDDLVATGSDDGRVFIYNAETAEIVQVLQADEDVANCVQAHPSLPLLATSGIESVVRLWSPGERPVEEDTVKIMHDNQQRMREGPQSVRGINPRVMQAFRDNPELLEVFIRRAGLEVLAREEDDDESGGGPQEIDCRVS